MAHGRALGAWLDLGSGRHLARHPRRVGPGEILERLGVAGTVALLERVVALGTGEQAAERAASPLGVLAPLSLRLPLLGLLGRARRSDALGTSADPHPNRS